MKSTVWIGLFFISTSLFCSFASAGKVDQVKKAVKVACNKDLQDSELMDAVLKAFDCVPGTDVKIADCKLKCLKEGDGNVVGK